MGEGGGGIGVGGGVEGEQGGKRKRGCEELNSARCLCLSTMSTLCTIFGQHSPSITRERDQPVCP